MLKTYKSCEASSELQEAAKALQHCPAVPRVPVQVAQVATRGHPPPCSLTGVLRGSPSHLSRNLTSPENALHLLPPHLLWAGRTLGLGGLRGY